MSIFYIILIGGSLSLDAVAVAIANNIHHQKINISESLKLSFSFGFFQMLMPILGWSAGVQFDKYINNFDHWIVFFLLLFIGVKMIYESFFKSEFIQKTCSLGHFKILCLSIATSIDALAVGISFAFLDNDIYFPAAIIGITTFILSLIGCFAGKKAGEFFGKKIQSVGGLILVIIGTKILIEHIYF